MKPILKKLLPVFVFALYFVLMYLVGYLYLSGYINLDESILDILVLVLAALWLPFYSGSISIHKDKYGAFIFLLLSIIMVSLVLSAIWRLLATLAIGAVFVFCIATIYPAVKKLIYHKSSKQ